MGKDISSNDPKCVHPKYALFRRSRIYLNESSFSHHLKLFQVHKYIDLGLQMGGRHDGLQEFATYTPPGPSQPGAINPVSSFYPQIQYYIQTFVCPACRY